MEYYTYINILMAKTCAYPFPITADGSVTFAYSGAVVFKAVLEANDIPLSVVTFDDDNDEQSKDYSKDVPMTDIPFFTSNGEIVPFHCALTSKWTVKVTLYTKDQRMPSLTMKPTKTITWDDVKDGIYTDHVTVGSDSGNKTLTFVYTETVGGFKRE